MSFNYIFMINYFISKSLIERQNSKDFGNYFQVITWCNVWLLRLIENR